MGGEKISFPASKVVRMGSPPRGRGKGSKVMVQFRFQGITPAWAGKSTKPFPQIFFIQDHPRVGGEKLRFQVISARELGSPPRGRGKEKRPKTLGPAYRITPAWAGKSLLTKHKKTTGRDHPRVGGEKHTEQRATAHGGGSPPRGRGKVSSVSMCTRSPGITPAWAGKSIQKS